MGKGRSSATAATQADRSASLTSPFTDAHAIVFADFGLSVRKRFSRNQYDAIQRAIEPRLIEAGFQLQPPKEDDGAVGTLIYERAIAGSDDVAEEFHMHASHVHVMIHEYRGWQVTKATAMDRLAPVLRLFRGKSFAVKDARIVLGYRDAFLNEKPDRYSVLDVFKPNPHLPLTVFDGGKFWQHELTIVEEAQPEEDWGRIFARTTVDARVVNMAGARKKKEFVHWTEITHRQQLAGNEEGKSDVEWSEYVVAARFDALHARNKTIMVDLLNHEMADRIGLLEKNQ